MHARESLMLSCVDDLLCPDISLSLSESRSLFPFLRNFLCVHASHVIVVILCRISQFNKMQAGSQINARWILVPAVLGLGSFY